MCLVEVGAGLPVARTGAIAALVGDECFNVSQRIIQKHTDGVGEILLHQPLTQPRQAGLNLKICITVLLQKGADLIVLEDGL